MPRRIFAVLAFLFILPCSVAAPLSIQVKHLGVGNLYSLSTPVPLAVEVSNSSDKALHFDLVASILTFVDYQRTTMNSDSFRCPVTLAPGETRIVEFPIIFRTAMIGFSNATPKLTVEAHAEDGSVLAQAKVNSDVFKLSSANHIIVVLCDTSPGKCDPLQQAIAGTGSEEQINKKSNQLHLVSLSHLPLSWWSYSPADFVVVGKPLSTITPEERQSLSEFLFSGGSVVLLEDVAGEVEWLAPFRQGALDGYQKVLGEGALHRVHGANSPELQGIFDRLISDNPSIYYQKKTIRYPAGFSVGTLLSRNSERFDYPSAQWLLWYLAAYIVFVGPISFFALRRFRKLEWGWVSVAVIAVLFGLALYALSSARRPKQPCLDEVAVYQMDHRSPVATVHYSAQLSSPDRLRFNVSAPGEAILQSLPTRDVNPLASELPSGITSRGHRTQSTDLRVGSATEFALDLRRWTARTMDWKDVRILPGSITTDGNGTIKNLTGLEFKNALYADWNSGDVYLLGHVAAGATLDLNKLFHVSIKNVAAEKRAAMKDAQNRLPFDLQEVLLESESGQTFYGLADGPVLGIRTDQPATRHRTTSLFVVNMEHP